MGQLLELSACQRLHEVLRHTAFCRDIRQVDFGRRGRRKFDFRLLGSLFQTLHSHRVFRQVDAFVALEILHEPVDDDLVEIVAAEVRVAIRRDHFKHTTTKFEDGNIERTATEVEHGDFHIFVSLIDTVGQSGSRRLVHDALHVQTCNLTSLFCGLTLRVGEIGRHGDDGVGHFLSEIVLGGLFHLLEHHRRDFLRRVFASVDIDTRITSLVHNRVRHALGLFAGLFVGFTHKTLDRIDRVFRVRNGLTLGRIAHLALAFFHKTNHRGSRALALAVGDYYWLVALKHGNAAVGSS